MPEILKRTSLSITEKEFIARFEVGFPANGRTINAPELEKIFFDFLPKAVTQSFFYRNLKAEEVRQVIELSEDQPLSKSMGLIAPFVADGYSPSESGISATFPMSPRKIFPIMEKITEGIRKNHTCCADMENHAQGAGALFITYRRGTGEL